MRADEKSARPERPRGRWPCSTPRPALEEGAAATHSAPRILEKELA